MNNIKLGVIALAITSFLLFGMVLTPCVSAQLALDGHPPTKLVDKDGNARVSVYVSIDSLDYNAGDGSVSVDGSFYVHNYDQLRGKIYNGELRLEILDLEGNAYLPHTEEPIYGQVQKNDEDTNWWNVIHSDSKNATLHVECLRPSGDAKPIEKNERYMVSVNIALRVTGFHQEETWEASYSTEFEHDPEDDVEQLEGIGPTTDGETFSDDCTVRTDEERDSWQSLVYTDILYHAVYWYVKAPGDTSAYGTFVEADWGDGVTRKATMTTSFPDDVDDPNHPGDQDRVFYKITAYIYRWDLSVYTISYLVDVYDD